MITNKNNRPKQRRTAAAVNEMCAGFAAECRRRGLRLTPQRLAVYRDLAGDASHPTADSVYERLQPVMTGLSLATVYRILESLEHEGFVRRVSTTDGVGRYDARLTAHQHLVCRGCGRMTDAEIAALGRLGLPRRGPAGFLPERLDIRIVGTCASCRRHDGRTAKLK